MDREELAWAAGFMDGEAFIGATSRANQPHKRLVLSVAQVHREPLDRLCGLFGGSVCGPYPSRHANGQPYFQFQQDGLEAVQATIARVWLFLSSPKREQARDALSIYAAWIVEKEERRVGRLRMHCARGHPFTEANSMFKEGRRRCRACDNLNQRRRYRERRQASLDGRMEDR